MFKIFKRKREGLSSSPQPNFKVCPKCHTRGNKYDISCASCGTQFGDEIYCACGSARPAGSRFCPFCGMDDLGNRKRQTELTESQETWQRKEKDFATVFTQSELMSKGLDQFVINAGTTGMLYQRGRFVGALNPGPHRFKSLGDRFSRFREKDAFQVVLMDVGDMVLPFTIENLAHGDDMRSFDKKNLQLLLIFRMENPDLFQVNVIKDQKHLELSWLRTRIEKTLDQRVREAIKQNPAMLDEDNLGQRLHMLLLDHFEESLNRMGMKLVDLEVSFQSFSTELDKKRQDTLFELKGRYVEISNIQNLWDLEREERAASRTEDDQRFDEAMTDEQSVHQQDIRRTKQDRAHLREMDELLLSGKRSDLTLTEKEMSVFYETGLLELKKADQEMLIREQNLLREQKSWLIDFQQRRKELEQSTEEQALELKELAQEARTSQEKLSLLDTLLVSQNREKMMNLQSEEDWSRYKKEVDRKNLMDERDWAELQTAAVRKSHDDEAAWQHLQQVLEMQRENEIRQVKALQEREAQKTRFDSLFDEKKSRLKIEDLDGQQVEDSHKREMRIREAELLGTASAEAKASSLRHQSVIEQKRGELELELLKKERELALKRSADMGDVDEQQRRLEMTLAMEERKHQMKLQEKAMDHDQSLEKAKSFGNLPMEAMIATITDPGIRESIIKTMKTRYEGENLTNLTKDRQTELMQEINNLKRDLTHQNEISQKEHVHFKEMQDIKEGLQIENKETLKKHIEDLKEEHGRERVGTHALTDSVMKGAAGVAYGTQNQPKGPERMECRFCGKQTVLFPNDVKCSHCGGMLR